MLMHELCYVFYNNYFKAGCAKENQNAAECGSGWNKARNSCCEGLVCNFSTNRCVTESIAPSTALPLI